MKIQPRPKGQSGIIILERLKGEIAIMKKISHPNLVTLKEVINDESSKKLYLIIDYCDLGYIGSPDHLRSLYKENYNRRTTTIPISKIRTYFRGCAKAIDYRKCCYLTNSAFGRKGGTL